MSAKKKIFITTHDMRLDGAERSLIGLLSGIDYRQYEVDLFILLHTGPLLQKIPKEVNILPEIGRYKAILSPAKSSFKKGYLDVIFKKWRALKNAKKFIKDHTIGKNNMIYPVYLHKELCSVLPIINNVHYDLAISFLNPHYITTHKVRARKKIAWIHNDYSFFEVDRQTELKMWNAYDHIISISKESSKSFNNLFPELQNKTVLIENALNVADIKKQSNEIMVESEISQSANQWVLLSIGRFTYAKNFDNIPLIAALLKLKGFKLKWFIIGFGDDEKLIRKKIRDLNVEDNVIILGKKNNPYPYIKACDVYIQPSRSEGKSVCVREAQILGKPVVITSYKTASSQLDHKVDGIIVPLDNEGCANGIAELLDDNELRNTLSANCNKKDYSNKDDIKKLYSLISS